MSRPLHGAIAGFCATLAMTAAMRLLHARLPLHERYPLPPREITQTVFAPDEERARDVTIVTHFGFGALAGALYGLLPRRPPGILFGPLVWAASYLGWAPLAGILKPATRHPADRNLLMVAVHVLWGAFLALGIDELERSARTIFAGGRLADRERTMR